MNRVIPETVQIHRGAAPLDAEGFIRARYELTLACAQARQELIDAQSHPNPGPVPSLLPKWLLWLATGFNTFRNRIPLDGQLPCFALRCHAVMDAMQYASVIAAKELTTLAEAEDIVTILGVSIGRLTLSQLEDNDADAEFCYSKYAVLEEHHDNLRRQARVIWAIIDVNTWFCKCAQCTAYNAIFNLKLDTCYCLRCRRCKSALESHRTEE